MSEQLTYASLFSAAGLGCFGFKLEGFKCVATAELVPRRLQVQRANDVADEDSQYFLGDLSSDEALDKVSTAVRSATQDLTVVVATPPCQGMSVANHKKGNELARNSLVVSSLQFIEDVRPRFFLLENVRGFLTAKCVDTDGEVRSIVDAIHRNLGAYYNIDSLVANLKDYGSPSSRTRTLVIGTRRDIPNVTPHELFPKRNEPPTLRELIGGLKPLNDMGEIDPDDIYHSFRNYEKRMRPWIAGLGEGQTAFSNSDPRKRPHRVIDGKRVENKSSNGDKYKRNHWDKVAPCVHTRNDILASQATVHPVDDRVFSIRELCLMMGVPKEFRWAEFSLNELNALPLDEKVQFLNEHEMNIRQCLGEGVPTPVFQSIASNIRRWIEDSEHIHDWEKFAEAESNNPNRRELSAYYTRQDIVFSLLSNLPKEATRPLKVLEPAVGAGAFLPNLFRHFGSRQIELDVIDKDPAAISNLSEIVSPVPPNVNLTCRVEDFLDAEITQHYDLVVGNPPFGAFGAATTGFGVRDLYARFLEKCMKIADTIAFVIPKSFLGGPEYQKLRDHIAREWHVIAVEDYGESAFSSIKIETIGIVISKLSSPGKTIVTSYPLKNRREVSQRYLTDVSYPSWLLYRNAFFDRLSDKMQLGCFSHYRDRQLTKSKMSSAGQVPVVKARLIRNGLVEEPTLFCSKEDIPSTFADRVSQKNCLVVPNLSYYPRAARLPDNMYPDGSAAVLVPNENNQELDPGFYATSEFFYFYRIARNYSVRSLNVDALSVFYWGTLKERCDGLLPNSTPAPGSRSLYHWPDLAIEAETIDLTRDSESRLHPEKQRYVIAS